MNGKMIMLLSSFSFFYSCALFQGTSNTSGLGVVVFEVNNQVVKNVKVVLKQKSGEQHTAKYNSSLRCYYFSTHFSEGTLTLKHRNYDTEEYQLKEILPNKVGISLSLFLKTKTQRSFTSGGIRYPYIPQPDILAVLPHESNLRNQQQTSKILEGEFKILGLKQTDLQSLGSRKELIPPRTPLALLYNRGSLKKEEEKDLIDFLENHSEKLNYGPVLGPSRMLSTHFYIRLKDLKHFESAQELMKAEKLEIIKYEMKEGYFHVRYPSLDDQKIISTIETLNQSDLFHTIQPQVLDLWTVELED